MVTSSGLVPDSAQLGYLRCAHCTGIEDVFRIRELAALDRKRAVVAAAGA